MVGSGVLEHVDVKSNVKSTCAHRCELSEWGGIESSIMVDVRSGSYHITMARLTVHKGIHTSSCCTCFAIILPSVVSGSKYTVNVGVLMFVVTSIISLSCSTPSVTFLLNISSVQH